MLGVPKPAEEDTLPALGDAAFWCAQRLREQEWGAFVQMLETPAFQREPFLGLGDACVFSRRLLFTLVSVFKLAGAV